MRIVFWLLVAVAFFYSFYSGAMAVWSYMQVSGVVDQALEDRHLGDKSERARQVRAAIVRGAAKTGVALDEREVNVTQFEGGIVVSVRWTYPVITYNEETVFAIPLSIDRSRR